MAIIKVKNLYKIYGKHPDMALKMLEEGHSKEKILSDIGQTVGLNNISFEVEPGEAFVVMGLSGSGKSTLIRCLNRLIDSTSGSIIINGKDITKMNKKELNELRREKISMVFQSFAVFPHKTVLENAAYGLKIMGISQVEREKKAYEALEMVGLKGWEDFLPSNLSGGMQQRVGLARALATEPDILLMDEAFSALDPLIRKEMQTELLELQERMKKTIVFITHDLDEALRIGDRIALMKEGEIVQVGTPEEIMMSPATDYVEKFVEDVDRSRVLTAEMIMKKPSTVVIHPKDGPRIALHRMEESNISSIFVLDKQNCLLGLVMAEDALQAIEKNEKSLENIIRKDIPTVFPETLLKDMFSLLTGKSLPLAVVDDNHKFKGIVLRGTVMAKLAGGIPSD
ncbi:Glycine betaine transport ATP-binding protein OpuAA [Sporotomaculum syntrophicum]|uniref:Quaternary amine transport ATP-binding protein n=1 Tax=Sporotomaculum syntrophicum TaxID=182264 RepID=A0A9D2WN15_9FIRM|nr:glycine betaine/L-proline ABC transporter ATP-binding protein [Sporotomaculum syntrophicum]KAF1084420.1 Glycine betaine transport ATP-binding protein OpuAA [Sporotomaculum syntrophicum]